VDSWPERRVGTREVWWKVKETGMDEEKVRAGQSEVKKSQVVENASRTALQAAVNQSVDGLDANDPYHRRRFIDVTVV